MSDARVTTVDDVLARGRERALECEPLAQEIWRVEPGTSRSYRCDGGSATVFVFGGTGRIRCADVEGPLEPETGAFAAADADVELEASGPEKLVVVAVRSAPAERVGAPVVRFADVGEESAGIGRWFRLLAQSTQATQFVGLVPPGRAKMHNHPYDELACVIEGEGVLHWHEGGSTPVRRGSLIHFPRLVFHSLENTGGGTLRIMGVFHPAGSPADRVEVLDY